MATKRDKTPRLGASVIENMLLSDMRHNQDDATRAARMVCANAEGVEDARMLLDALGLLDGSYRESVIEFAPYYPTART